MSPDEFAWTEQAGNASEEYDDFLVPGMFTPFGEKLLEEAGVGAGARVLDVACGTGIVSRLAARRAGSTGEVTGVDMTEPMLAVARAKPAEPGAAPITYVVGDAAALPVEDGSFEFVTCHHGLQFFPDKPAAIVDARRALTSGGVLAIGCWAVPMPPMQAVIEALTRHFGDEIGGAMGMPLTLGEPDALREVVEAGGFSDVDVHQVTMDATFSDRANFAPRTLAASPLAGQFAEAPEEARAAVTREVAEALEPYATDDGGLSAPLTSTIAIARN
jgi:ubiquinone/menaquinone biosynthesis C-methylase UbiE